MILKGMSEQGKDMVMPMQDFPGVEKNTTKTVQFPKAMFFSNPVKTQCLPWVSAGKMPLAITTEVMHLLLLSLHHTALWLFRAVIALHVRLMES